ncbi:MAG: hypothetical protein HUK24_05005, partial [Sphaerochaetaceae bacterium]|nr:hypothetical protein [Sphaerochaetaceae bacterium]
KNKHYYIDSEEVDETKYDNWIDDYITKCGETIIIIDHIQKKNNNNTYEAYYYYEEQIDSNVSYMTLKFIFNDITTLLLEERNDKTGTTYSTINGKNVPESYWK